jgi:hypothetical protein
MRRTSVRLGHPLAIQARGSFGQLRLRHQSDRDAEKFDYNSMNKFKGMTDSSSGYTVMRNLNGGAMRGYIDKDGSGLLRDQNGNFHNVNTRW